MKKAFKYYAVVWAILLIVFNVLCFATPNHFAGYDKMVGTFWGTYIFITLAFIGQLVCAYFAFKAENLQKLFYNMPLITVSYGGLVAMLIIGGAVMAVPNVPKWLGVILCTIVLAFTAIAVVKASAAAEAVEAVDRKIENKTSFIKDLTVDAEALLKTAQNEEIRKELNKVFEAVRYSDPVSNESLNEVNNRIRESFSALKEAVNTGDLDCVQKRSASILQMIQERSLLAKRNK